MSKLGKKAFALLLAGAMAMMPVCHAEAVGAGSSIARGIDVSKHNLAIDWSQVPSSGVSFVFIKAGSTNSGVDPYFDANMRGANAAGLKTGVYLYSYATNAEQAQNEANLILQWMSDYTVSYPVVYDIEDACHKNMSQAQLQELINTFCSAVEAQGYYPVVYSSKNMFQNKIGDIKYDKWVAQYADNLEYNGASFWQNTSHGSVAGIPTRVDMNYQFKDYSSVIVADGFASRGDQKVFYANYRMQRSCWANWEDRKYHLDENGFVQKGCWFEDETGRYFLATKDGHLSLIHEGTITEVGSDAGYPLVIEIEHGNGYRTRYMFAQEAEPIHEEGDKVQGGDVLAAVNAQNEQVDYQVIFEDEPIDPLIVFEAKG